MRRLGEQRDGDWVKVGGMITESKKIRTRTGTQMMFATLDDLDGSIEIVVFEKALDAVEQLLATDAIVLVRGRVDHKEAGKSCVIVQDAERFDPSDAEIEKAKEKVAQLAATMAPEPIRFRVAAARLQPTVISELRDLFERYPATPSSCSRWTPARACAACASATATRSPRATPACGPSCVTCSARPSRP